MDKTEARLKKLEERKREIEAKMQQIRARQSATERKKDTRRKVLAGAFLLEQVEKGEYSKSDFLRHMDAFLTRDIDRALFGISPKSEGDAGAV